MIRQVARAKVNLVLRIGPVADNGLHEVCSLFAPLELHDLVEVSQAGADAVVCPGVEGPNLAHAAIELFRAGHPGLPSLHVRIEKRIPVAAGLGGGSADAAAVLRAANEIAGTPFGADRLREMAALLGSDVPSQVEPGAAIVSGTGEVVEPVRLPEMAILLVPAEIGLATADVFHQADALGIPRERLDCGDLPALAQAPLPEMAARLENDLQRAAVFLREELMETVRRVVDAGALGAQVSGSGPTVFGVFADRQAAQRGAAAIPGSLVTMVAQP